MNKNMKAVMNKTGYYFDVESNTLYMTKAFERKTLQYGSPEFKTVREIQNLFPDACIEVCTRASKTKPLTYEMMKKFICLLPSAEEDLKEMERKQKMSVAYKSPYKFMEDWFNAKYPHHKELQVKDEKTGEVKWDILALRQEKEDAAEEDDAAANVVDFEAPHEFGSEDLSASA